MKVIKRDGRIENYDYSKIAKAVKGAALDVNETPPTLRLSFDKDEVSVDEIHDAVSGFGSGIGWRAIAGRSR